jgi:hypothetical protein
MLPWACPGACRGELWLAQEHSRVARPAHEGTAQEAIVKVVPLARSSMLVGPERTKAQTPVTAQRAAPSEFLSDLRYMCPEGVIPEIHLGRPQI